MNRYRINISIYIDAETKEEADNLVTEMMCGTERMSSMWSVDIVEKQWEHVK
jgi:hypothetical protein